MFEEHSHNDYPRLEKSPADWIAFWNGLWHALKRSVKCLLKQT